MSNEKSCAACPVADGTHKPTEAVHEIAEPKTQQPEALRLAEWLDEGWWPSYVPQETAAELRRQHARIAELEAQLAAAPQAEPASVIAGAIFDFAGYLTTLPHEKALHCSEAHEASPMVEAITEWCKRRGLRTDGARVETWRDHLAEAPAHPAEGVPAQDAELDIDGLIDRLLDAQQDLNLAANVHMDQSIASASTLLDEVEIALRTLAATQPAAQGMEQDAARYRWLRNHGFHSASAELGSDLDGAPFVCFVMRVHIPEPISLPYEEQEWTACDTDVAIDAALAVKAKQGDQQ